MSMRIQPFQILIMFFLILSISTLTIFFKEHQKKLKFLPALCALITATLLIFVFDALTKHFWLIVALYIGGFYTIIYLIFKNHTP
jgi:hypothetical protein